MKVVINVCFGGFGLSHEGILEYFKIKKEKIYFKWSDMFYTMQDEHGYTEKQLEESMLSYRNYYTDKDMTEDGYWYDRDIERHDPALVKMIEKIGKKSFGGCADLEVVEIPDDVEYEISEYDGNEHIAEKHRTWR